MQLFRTIRIALGSALPLTAALLSAQISASETSIGAEAPADSRTHHVEEEVVVRGRRLSEIEFDLRVYIHDFLAEVAAPVRNRGYARWYRRVCVGVHNLENSAAQYIVDRISALALDVGLQPGEPGCRPQVNIFFTHDAKETASSAVDNYPRMFRRAGGHAGMDLGLAALDDFANSERAVRWWHVSLPVDSRHGTPAIALPEAKTCSDLHCPPHIAVAGPSRVHSGIRDDLQYVIIIVDVTKLTGTTWQQLADYLAVVSLAQIDPKTNPTGFDSILNLFDNPAAYSGLTDWDRSFVNALYSFNQERMPRAQRNEIVSRILQQELALEE